ncbi:hypothetical protein BGX23_008514 [Mortierella sp. AD031]|nr:hypothetical protein BGX23_008514 [Mortierella sp. AD031]
MSSHYFCLIKARTYSVVSNYCSKAARTVAAGHQSKPQERITHTDGMDLEASLPNSHGHTDFQECVAHMNVILADSCIAQQWAKAWDPSEVLVITGDSDLTVYKSIPRVALPVGKSRELNNMFEKKSILAALDLPTDNHLLLAPIFGNNDCTIGVPCFGLERCCDIIRTMNQSSNDVWFAVELKDFKHALIAFVSMHWDP